MPSALHHKETGGHLPVQAGAGSPDEVVACNECSEAVDEHLKEEESWKVWLSPLNALQLDPNWFELSVDKEVCPPCGNQDKKKNPRGWVDMSQSISSMLLCLLGKVPKELAAGESSGDGLDKMKRLSARRKKRKKKSWKK